MVRLWVTIGWRWFLRIFIFVVIIPCFLLQAVYGVPTWDYLWSHYLWEPYVPFIVGFFVLFAFTFVPFGKKQPLGGENPNE